MLKKRNFDKLSKQKKEEKNKHETFQFFFNLDLLGYFSS